MGCGLLGARGSRPSKLKPTDLGSELAYAGVEVQRKIAGEIEVASAPLEIAASVEIAASLEIAWSPRRFHSQVFQRQGGFEGPGVCGLKD